MHITGIFEKVKDRLFAVCFEDLNQPESKDELDKALDFWRDIEALWKFFNHYREDLSKFESGMNVKAAVKQTAEEAEEIYDRLVEFARNGKLDELFKPLDNRELDESRYEFQKLKAKGERTSKTFNMANEKNKKPKALAEAIPSYGWMEREDYKKENRDWLRSSRRVALRVLDALEKKKMSQQDLADILKVTRQQVSKIVKGQENFTFATVIKLQHALGINLKDIFEETKALVQETHLVTAVDISLVKGLDDIINKNKPISLSQPTISEFIKQQYGVEYQKEFLAGAGESNYAMAS